MLDPAVGGGAFLVEAYLRMVKLGIEEPSGRLFGVDLDGVLRNLSAIVVAFLSEVQLDGQIPHSANFVRGDSLLTSLDGAPPRVPLGATGSRPSSDRTVSTLS